MLLQSCSESVKVENHKNQIEKGINNEYIVYNEKGQFKEKYNYDINLGKVINDSRNTGIIRYDYNENDKLYQIAFLDKDSIHNKRAFKRFEFDNDGRLIKEKYLNKEKKLLWTEISYLYKGSLIERKEMPEWDRATIYEYDSKNRIIKEKYVKLNGDPDMIGEMGIRFITYLYNSKNQLVEEIYHYTGTLDPLDRPKLKWVNEYIYDKNGVLVESRYKFKAENKKYDNITYFKYDPDRQLYGYGEKKEEIKIHIPYNDLSEITYQELYSDDYHTNIKHPIFRNY